MYFLFQSAFHIGALEILYLLANSPGRIYSKEQIYDIVWQEPYSGDYNIVMSHIHHIREKIEGKPLCIQTVWGIGYRFNKNLSSNYTDMAGVNQVFKKTSYLYEIFKNVQYPLCTKIKKGNETLWISY